MNLHVIEIKIMISFLHQYQYTCTLYHIYQVDKSTVFVIYNTLYIMTEQSEHNRKSKSMSG